MRGILLDGKILLRESSISIDRDFDILTVTLKPEAYFGTTVNSEIKEKIKTHPISIIIEKRNHKNEYKKFKDSSNDLRMESLFEGAKIDLNEVEKIRSGESPLPFGFEDIEDYDRTIPDETLYSLMEYCRNFKTKELINL